MPVTSMTLQSDPDPEPVEYALCRVRPCTIDATRMTEGPATVTLYGDLVQIDGGYEFVTADWGGPRSEDWRNTSVDCAPAKE